MTCGGSRAVVGELRRVVGPPEQVELAAGQQRQRHRRHGSSLTDDEVETFWRDGVVCLRDVMPTEWLDYMEQPVDESLGTTTVADLSAMADAMAGRADTNAAGPLPRRHRSLARSAGVPRFAAESPLAAIAAQLLRTQGLWLYEDSVLVKEPGTTERTAFHQDMAYFHLDGDQVCTTWVPLDRVDAENGAVQFVRGSHLRRTRLRPNLFVTSEPIPGTEGEVVPDFSESAELVSFDTRPGDITVHHRARSTARTQRERRAGAGRSPCATRATMSCIASSAARPPSGTMRRWSKARRRATRLPAGVAGRAAPVYS